MDVGSTGGAFPFARIPCDGERPIRSAGCTSRLFTRCGLAGGLLSTLLTIQVQLPYVFSWKRDIQSYDFPQAFGARAEVKKALCLFSLALKLDLLQASVNQILNQ